jgi:hypothetical protein
MQVRFRIRLLKRKIYFESLKLNAKLVFEIGRVNEPLVRFCIVRWL